MAASLLLLVGGGLFFAYHKTRPPIYMTPIGGQQTVKLEDGSVMVLNTDSRAQVRFDEQGRHVRLLAGEALFAVVQDAKRPFIVLTETASVRALGTQFNVRRSVSSTQVAVIEGAVQVSRSDDAPVRLAAGDEAVVDMARIMKRREPNVQRAVAWRTRRLVFPSAPVEEIAAEFNRYNRVKIEIEGERIRQHRMSGVFDADDPQPLLYALKQEPGVVVVEESERIVVKEK